MKPVRRLIARQRSLGPRGRLRSRLNYRNFKLGVTYHDDDTGQYDGAAIFFGMDLYQFLGEKQRSYKAYLEEIRN